MWFNGNAVIKEKWKTIVLPFLSLEAFQSAHGAPRVVQPLSACIDQSLLKPLDAKRVPIEHIAPFLSSNDVVEGPQKTQLITLYQQLVATEYGSFTSGASFDTWIVADTVSGAKAPFHQRATLFPRLLRVPYVGLHLKNWDHGKRSSSSAP